MQKFSIYEFIVEKTVAFTVNLLRFLFTVRVMDRS